MEHLEYRRIVPGADTAVLFIHGIVGTPEHFSTVLPLVQKVPQEYSVCNLLLDGHGGSVDDFSRTSMKIWQAQVKKAFCDLAETHQRVILCAHSMGTLFAIQLALAYPDKIPFLFLLAVPLCPGLRVAGVIRILRMVFGRTREEDPVEVATRQVCGVRTTRRLWRYIPWIARFLELFSLIARTKAVIGQLRVPAVSFQSRQDELVRNRAEKLLTDSKRIKVIPLPDSTHFYYAPGDRERILDLFENMIKEKRD